MTDMIFKVHYDKLGAHVHCRVFSVTRAGATLAKLGDLVVRIDELDALQAAMPGIIFEERGYGAGQGSGESER